MSSIDGRYRNIYVHKSKFYLRDWQTATRCRQMTSSLDSRCLFFLLAIACSGVREGGLPPSMLLAMARAKRLTFLDLALPCILFLAAAVCASEVPVATSPIITTVTQTDTQLSTTIIGTSVSTSTSQCADGSCIVISLVSVPIVSTITVLSGSTYVSTVGYTTIYSSVADVVVCIQSLYF